MNTEVRCISDSFGIDLNILHLDREKTPTLKNSYTDRETALVVLNGSGVIKFRDGCLGATGFFHDPNAEY